MFSDRIKELRLKRGYSQKKLADMLYVDQTTISYWENGKSFPDYNKQQILADIFDVSIDYLTGRTDSSAKRRAKKIPVLGYVQAGIPIDAIENILDYEEISDDMASTGEYVGLMIRGDSMEPRFKEGDVVIVRIQSDCDSGDIAVVLINGDEATVKKIEKTRAGIKLIPFNSSYDPLFYTNQEIEELPVRLFGRVVELRAKF